MSTAGGTLGTAQRSMNDTVNSAMAGDNTVFSDEGTYDSYSADRSRNGQARSSSMNCGGDRGRMSSSSGNERQRKSNGGARERTIVVVAPPGKLGVVIDSSSEDGGDGMPMIHAVKDSSPVVGKLQVGDRVIAVDDEDVYDLSAIMVSKIISRKSSNPARRLTVIRTL